MSWEDDNIAGYTDAVASETSDRAFAFLELPEIIGGVECEPLTPYRIEWLKAAKSPFMIGGKVSTAAVIQFLWLINKGFTKSKEALDIFIASHLDIDYEQTVKDIDEYLDRAFLDAPDGGGDGRSFYSMSASLILAMCGKDFNWQYKQVMNTPVRILFQILKAHHKSIGVTVINKRSQKIECDWLDKVALQCKQIAEQEDANG